MEFHEEILTDAQRNALRQLGPFATGRVLYLGGGTAVALHLGHRQSVDFDWLGESPLAHPMQLAQELRDSGVDFETGTVGRGTLHGTVAGVRVSFLEYRYPLLKPLVPWPEYDCSLATLEDLAAMKLLATAQRGTKRDFFDICAIGARICLADMLECYQRKFSVDDVSRVLYGLCYFEDADQEPMPAMLRPADWDQVKRTIGGWVKEIVA